VIGLLDDAVDFLIHAGPEKTKVLVVTAKEQQLFKYAKVYARDRHKTAAMKVSDWTDLLKKLEAYVEIGLLVMFFHGFPGGMDVGTEKLDLGESNLTRGRRIPRIARIELIGCNVSSAPERLVNFAKSMRAEGATKAPVVVGYNNFYVPNLVKFSVKEGATAESIEAMDGWKRYDGYWMSNPPRTSRSIAAQPGPVIVGAEWFHKAGKTDLPPPGDLERPKFLPRKGARDKNISDEDDALALKQAYAAWEGGGLNPSLELHRVIVTLP